MMDNFRTRQLARLYLALTVISALFIVFATLARAGDDDVKWVQVFQSEKLSISVASNEITEQHSPDSDSKLLIQGFFQSSSPVLGFFEAWILKEQCYANGSGGLVLQTLRSEKGQIKINGDQSGVLTWDWDGQTASDAIGHALCLNSVVSHGYSNARPRGLHHEGKNEN